MSNLLSIIIPVYNEEKIITASLPAIFDLEINKEVIVINDGSSDNTLNILHELEKKYPFILIDKKVNTGKGESVKLGLSKMTGDYFIICDADLEYDPNDIVRLVSEAKKLDEESEDLSKNKRIAFYGSRFLENRAFTFHSFVNWSLTFLTNILFGGKLSDMETCFKLIPSSALEKIKLSGQRFEIEPEITAQLLKNKFKIREIPISYNKRGYKEGKKIKARDGFLAIKTLIKERLN